MGAWPGLGRRGFPGPERSNNMFRSKDSKRNPSARSSLTTTTSWVTWKASRKLTLRRRRQGKFSGALRVAFDRPERRRSKITDQLVPIHVHRCVGDPQFLLAARVVQ